MFRPQFSDGTVTSPHYFACPDCDALFSAPVVREGERVMCPRCGANLFSRRPNFVHRATALVFAAAFFFILANAFPFLTLRADYRESYMHLAGCVSGLEEQGFPVLAATVGVFTLVAPILLVGALLYVLVPLLRQRRLPCALPLCRTIHEARRWNMDLSEASDTVKRQPCRLIWPSTKKYSEESAIAPPQSRPTPAVRKKLLQAHH